MEIGVHDRQGGRAQDLGHIRGPENVRGGLIGKDISVIAVNDDRIGRKFDEFAVARFRLPLGNVNAEHGTERNGHRVCFLVGCTHFPTEKFHRADRSAIDHQGKREGRTQARGQRCGAAQHAGQRGDIGDEIRPAALERVADQSADAGLEGRAARERDELAACKRRFVPELGAMQLVGLLVFVPAGAVLPIERAAHIRQNLAPAHCRPVAAGAARMRLASCNTSRCDGLAAKAKARASELCCSCGRIMANNAAAVRYPAGRFAPRIAGSGAVAPTLLSANP